MTFHIYFLVLCFSSVICSGENIPDPEDMGKWTSWAECSSTCTGGVHMRTCAVNENPWIAAKPKNRNYCILGMVQREICNEIPCSGKVAKIDGLTQWGEWSTCEDNPVKKCRKRSCQDEGKGCAGPEYEMLQENERIIYVAEDNTNINSVEGNQLANSGEIGSVIQVKKENSNNIVVNSNSSGGGAIISQDDGWVNGLKIVSSGENSVNVINTGNGTVNIYQIIQVAESSEGGWKNWGPWTCDNISDKVAGVRKRSRVCENGMKCTGKSEQTEHVRNNQVDSFNVNKLGFLIDEEFKSLDSSPEDKLNSGGYELWASWQISPDGLSLLRQRNCKEIKCIGIDKQTRKRREWITKGMWLVEKDTTPGASDKNWDKFSSFREDLNGMWSRRRTCARKPCVGFSVQRRKQWAKPLQPKEGKNKKSETENPDSKIITSALPFRPNETDELFKSMVGLEDPDDVASDFKAWSAWTFNGDNVLSRERVCKAGLKTCRGKTNQYRWLRSWKSYGDWDIENICELNLMDEWLAWGKWKKNSLGNWIRIRKCIQGRKCNDRTTQRARCDKQAKGDCKTPNDALTEDGTMDSKLNNDDKDFKIDWPLGVDFGFNDYPTLDVADIFYFQPTRTSLGKWSMWAYDLESNCVVRKKICSDEDDCEKNSEQTAPLIDWKEEGDFFIQILRTDKTLGPRFGDWSPWTKHGRGLSVRLRECLNGTESDCHFGTKQRRRDGMYGYGGKATLKYLSSSEKDLFTLPIISPKSGEIDLNPPSGYFTLPYFPGFEGKMRKNWDKLKLMSDIARQFVSQ